jgi:Sulfotransferase domain
LSGQTTTFDNVNRGIPEIGIHPSALRLLPGEGRLIKTHEPYRKEYRRALYLVRDMRDVIFSQFSREKELGILYNEFDDYLERFLRGRISGFGAWQNHVFSWLGSPLAQRGDLLVLRFEDMRRNMEGAISEILDFLGTPRDAESIRAAIAGNTLDKMREKENQAERLHKSDREEGRFVRKGSVGGWREKLTDDQLRLIDRLAGPALARMGYPTGHASAEEHGADEALSLQQA